MREADDRTQLNVAMAVVAQLDPYLTREELVDKAARGDYPQPKATKPVLAYVNDSRWVADCQCGGAELVRPGDPMLCGSCGTTSKVKFPKDKAEIERLLNLRAIENRNWNPDETVEQLVAENIENGIWEGN